MWQGGEVWGGGGVGLCVHGFVSVQVEMSVCRNGLKMYCLRSLSNSSLLTVFLSLSFSFFF